jgi:hypothetical protein
MNFRVWASTLLIAVSWLEPLPAQTQLPAISPRPPLIPGRLQGFVRSTVIAVDTFEQVSQAQMMAEWPMIGTVGTHLQLTAADALRQMGTAVQPQSPTHACFEPLGQSGRSVHLRSLDPRNGIVGSDSEPLHFSFDIWLPSGMTNGRENARFSQRYFTLANWDNTAVLSLGPTSTGGMDDRFWALGQSDGRSSTVRWTQLRELRRSGWNRLEATIRSREIDITINGTNVGTFQRLHTSGYGQLIMGSGLPNNTNGGNGISFIDNIFLTRWRRG